MYVKLVCCREFSDGLVLILPIARLQVVVTLMALSSDGSVMSTIEVRLPEEDIGGLICLKFWTSSSQNKQFTLSTVIYEPHRYQFFL